MNPKAMRLLGIFFVIFAATIAVLNLKSVADLGVNYMPPIFLILGIILLRRAKTVAAQNQERRKT
jgi:hypothetical protein